MIFVAEQIIFNSDINPFVQSLIIPRFRMLSDAVRMGFVIPEAECIGKL